MEFSRQEYWSGLLFPTPGDLPNPGNEPTSNALQADSLPSEPPGKPLSLATHDQNQFLIGQLHPNASGTPQHAYLLNHNSSTLVQMLKNLPAMRETPVQSLI